MQAIRYNDEKAHLETFGELVQTLYAQYPFLAESKIREAQKNFDRCNPFLKHGSYTNFLVVHGGKPVAHISAIIDSRLPAHVGLFGHFECMDDIKIAKIVFREAQKLLRSHGKTVIRGPVNFSTWRTFRVSYPEDEPPFFVEPFTRSYYRDLWKGFSFVATQHNVSTIEEVEKTSYKAFEEDYRRLMQAGMTFESMKKTSARNIAKTIFELTHKIFSDTWSFVPIGLDEFSYTFGGILEVIDGDFIFLVKDCGNSPIGFCFAIPDYYSGRSKRLILKTIGVLPGYQGRGVGKALFYLLYNASCQRNIVQLIVSTMRSDNRAMRTLTRSAHIYRHYETYELVS